VAEATAFGGKLVHKVDEEGAGPGLQQVDNQLLSVRDERGRSPLQVATWEQAGATFGLLMGWIQNSPDAGTLLNLADERDQRTALHESCRKGSIGMVQELLRAGANTQVVDCKGKRAKQYARQYDHEEVLQFFAAFEAAHETDDKSQDTSSGSSGEESWEKSRKEDGASGGERGRDEGWAEGGRSEGASHGESGAEEEGKKDGEGEGEGGGGGEGEGEGEGAGEGGGSLGRQPEDIAVRRASSGGTVTSAAPSAGSSPSAGQGRRNGAGVGLETPDAGTQAAGSFRQNKRSSGGSSRKSRSGATVSGRRPRLPHEDAAQVAELLEGAAVFEGVDSQVLGKLARRCQVQVLDVGQECEWGAGEEPAMFIVIRGKVLVRHSRLVPGRKEREETERLFTRGAVFGEAQLMTGGRAPSNAGDALPAAAASPQTVDVSGATLHISAQGQTTSGSEGGMRAGRVALAVLTQSALRDLLDKEAEHSRGKAVPLRAVLLPAAARALAQALYGSDADPIHVERAEKRVAEALGVPASHHEEAALGRPTRSARERRLPESALAPPGALGSVRLARFRADNPGQNFAGGGCSDVGDPRVALHRTLGPLALVVPDDGSGWAEYVAAALRLGVAVQPAVLQALRGEGIVLDRCMLSSRQGLALGAALVNNDVVRRVDVSGSALGDEGLGVVERAGETGVLQALADHKGGCLVETLRLDRTHCGRRAAPLLRALVARASVLSVLSLANNSLGDHGGQALGEALHETALRRSGGSVSVLCLANNALGNRAAAALADWLSCAPNAAAELDIGYNHVREAGAVALMEGLAANRSLHTLSIGWNGLGADGGRAMGMMLAENRNLTRLDCSNCRMTVECTEELSAGLAANDTVQTLLMEWNPFGDGVPQLLEALAGASTQPRFSLDNCGFDLLAHGGQSQVDARNPTGHYTLNLAQPAQREQLQLLVEAALRDAGDSWRNETLDGHRFVFPAVGAWDIPDQGILDLDFVALSSAASAGAPADAIDPASFQTLVRLLSRTISSAGRVQLVRQAAASFTFTAPQVIELLKSFVREIEKEEAFIALFARIVQRARNLQRILLQSFSREEVEGLQRRLGPRELGDENRPAGRYRFDLAKNTDRQALNRLRELLRMRTFQGRAVAFQVQDCQLHNIQRRLVSSGVDLDRLVDGFLDKLRTFERAGVLVLRVYMQMEAANEQHFWRKSLSQGVQQRRARVQRRAQREQGNATLEALPLERRRSYAARQGSVGSVAEADASLPGQHAGEASAVVRGDDVDDAAGAGGYGGVADERPGSAETAEPKRLELWPRPLGEDEEQALVAEQQAAVAKARRRERTAAAARNIISAASLDDEVPGSLAQRNSLRPWITFRRSKRADHEVQNVQVAHSALPGTGTGAGFNKLLRAKVSEAGCVNFAVDLSIPAQTHTIPRHLTFTLRPLPPATSLDPALSFVANLTGLPWEDDYVWKGVAPADSGKRGAQSRSELVISIEPSDMHAHQGPGGRKKDFFHLTILTRGPSCEVELCIAVAPYASILRDIKSSSDARPTRKNAATCIPPPHSPASSSGRSRTPTHPGDEPSAVVLEDAGRNTRRLSFATSAQDASAPAAQLPRLPRAPVALPNMSAGTGSVARLQLRRRSIWGPERVSDQECIPMTVGMRPLRAKTGRHKDPVVRAVSASSLHGPERVPTRGTRNLPRARTTPTAIQNEIGVPGPH
jgi:hypothetical protein